MKNTCTLAALILALSAAPTLPAIGQQTTGSSHSLSANETQDRSLLPMPNTVRQKLVTYDAKSPDTKFPPIEQVRPPKGAPNVLVVLIDDAGFGASSTFG